MKMTLNRLLLAAALPLLLLADIAPHALLGLSFVREAAAIIGRPLTPVSYAGVARRTTRRAVYATSVTASSAASASASQQQQQQQPAAPPPSPPAGSLPVGTVVSALPSGCVSAPISGVEYYLCGGVYYRPAFQGNNLIYVVQKP